MATVSKYRNSCGLSLCLCSTSMFHSYHSSYVKTFHDNNRTLALAYATSGVSFSVFCSQICLSDSILLAMWRFIGVFIWQMQVPDLALLALGPKLEVLGGSAIERAGVAACKPGQDWKKCAVILVRLVYTIYRYWMRNQYNTAIHSMGLPP